MFRQTRSTCLGGLSPDGSGYIDSRLTGEAMIRAQKMKKGWWISLILCLQLILAPAYPWAGQAVFSYHNDTTGSPVAITNSAGTVVWKADYEPFGELAGVVENVPNQQQFLAKTVDPETSLHLLGARYYDGKMGRFLGVDPALLNGRPASAGQLPQRLNLYAYSTNNPYRYVDPNGQFLVPAIAIALGATVFFASTANTPQSASDALHNAQTSLEFGGSIVLSEIGGAAIAKGLGVLGDAVGSRVLGSTLGAKETLQTTAHGTERIAGAAATRGGVLSEAGVTAVQQGGRVMTQADGATIRILQNEAGRFNVVVEGQRGIITTFENLSQKSLDRLGGNYGWK